MKIEIVEMIQECIELGPEKWPKYRNYSKIIYSGSSDIIPRIGEKLEIPDTSDFFRVVDVIYDFQGPHVTSEKLLIYDNHSCTIQVKREIDA